MRRSSLKSFHLVLHNLIQFKIYGKIEGEGKNLNFGAFSGFVWTFINTQTIQQLIMSKIIKEEEFKKHNNVISGWLNVDGNVYDITPFFDEHPGGIEVLKDVIGKYSNFVLFEREIES